MSNEIKVGSKVKMDVDYLELIGFNGLHPEDNDEGTDHVSYILNDPDKVYEVIDIVENCPQNPYGVEDENLGQTSFSAAELILVEE